VLAGQLSLSKGQITWQSDGRQVPPDQVYQRVSYAAPYIELIEEFTLREAVTFHAQLQPLAQDLDVEMVLRRLDLARAHDKEIRFFSSGMKQRVKLALAICAATPILLLDEPTTNLDLEAIAWFQALLKERQSNRIVIIASNDPADLALCSHSLNIMDFKR
jgi:ABC-type multidrug transport system ATPase subunit